MKRKIAVSLITFLCLIGNGTFVFAEDGQEEETQETSEEITIEEAEAEPEVPEIQGVTEESEEIVTEEEVTAEVQEEPAEEVVTEEITEEIAETIEEKEEEYSGDVRSEPIPDGWKKYGNFWYYALSNRLISGWKKIDGAWYYFKPSSDGAYNPNEPTFAMFTGLKKIGGKYYGFASSGKMLTGWQKFSNKWYYFNSDGAAAVGWKSISGTWYYFDPSTAVMATGVRTISGKTYGFASSGAMLKGWQTINGELYYFQSDGSAKKLFSDVKDRSKYYFNAVYWGSDKGIVAGFNKGEYFGPELQCTRGQFVTFLWRMAGKPSSNAKLTFTDVSSDEYYYKALQWAYGKGIIGGYAEDNTFRPDNSVNRVSVALMLWKYAGRPNVNTSGASPFTDISATNTPSANAYKAVLWGQTKKITKGYSDGTFRPYDDCLREHIVTFLYRYATQK